MNRRGFLKGVLASVGLAIVAPYCPLTERPGLWVAAQPALLTLEADVATLSHPLNTIRSSFELQFDIRGVELNWVGSYVVGQYRP